MLQPFCVRGEQCVLHDGHPDGEAVGDLLEDGGLRAVGDACGDLHAADDGAGVHDDGAGRVGGEALAGELIAGLVFVEIELKAGEALGLDAEHHDGLRLAERGVEVALDFNAGTGVGGLLGK